MPTTPSSDFSRHWTLDPKVDFLNHGSFGACPRPVLELQAELRARLEAEPCVFMLHELEGRMDEARQAVAAFLGAQPEDMAFVSNATQGVNAVLGSLRFQPGDELLVTNHEYNASRNALNVAAERQGAKVVVAEVPFPGTTPELVESRVLEKVTPRTKLVMLDWINSPTGFIQPIESLVPKLRERGVETLIDGAHAPGQVPVRLEALGAGYFTGNLHKWVCAPKGAAVLHVRRDLRDQVRPTSISHGANSPRKDRSRFWLEFDWTGTIDPTPWLCAPESIRFLGSLLPGGWPEVMAANREKALRARDQLCQALKISAPVPDSMVGSMAAVPLPPGKPQAEPQKTLLFPCELQQLLFREYRIQVPIAPWPAPPARALRVSCQLYNHPEQYERLAGLLPKLV
ncbi:MAG TPA: aminotransferase class V-fold PLP-dependent enzyme [Myxococcaceae bacterium]|jgi:isopenicillin-N epimerase